MLLFFIAQMTAWADSCKSENLNDRDMSYTVYMCDYGFEKEVEVATKWWNSKGGKISVAEGVYDCKGTVPLPGEILIEFNDSQTKTKDTDDHYAGGVTSRNYKPFLGIVESSTIYLSTKTKKDKTELQTFIVHEMGHAIGYEHVPESCSDYIMNPYYKNMGIKL